MTEQTPRIGVNLMWLIPGVVGGSEDSTIQALRAVADLGSDAGCRAVLFANPLVFATHSELAERFEVHEIPFDAASKLRRVVAENRLLATAASERGVDLMHHAGGVVPPGVRMPSTLAIHDTQPLDIPANFSPTKRWYMRAMIGRSARTARLVTAPSEFVRGRIVALCNVTPEHVAVVPWSIPPVIAARAEQIDAVLAAHRLPRTFVLYPAITYVHKNHEVLLEAFARIADRTDADLVLTGGAGTSEEAVQARIRQPDLRGRVHRLGRIGRADLDVLVQAASVIAVPSRYEGFGLPALEALGAGRPTIVSDSGSLPDIVGCAAVVVDADDIDGWAQNLLTLLTDDFERERLIASTAEVAASFSPERTARSLTDVWTRAARSPS